MSLRLKTDQFIQAAFNEVCQEALQCNDETYYVVLRENVPFYGGPEEGGWWGSHDIVVAYQSFINEEQAQQAAEKVKEYAKKLSKESKKQFGEQCLREMKYCEERGLDMDGPGCPFPEPDGESTFHVVVTNKLPQNSYGSTHYE